SITPRRLRAQRLIGKPFASPVDVVRWLGAVQSQDYAGAKWALAQRSQATTDAAIDRLFDQGAILRTHVMRPTWHFVVPEDIRWLIDLTAPRVRLGLASRYRELQIDDRVAARAGSAFAKALTGGRHLTRPELGRVLSAAGISPDGKADWLDAATRNATRAGVVAHLLPNFYEYTVGYRVRSALVPADGRFDPSLFSFGSILSNVIAIGGVVHGAWRRSSSRGGVLI